MPPNEGHAVASKEDLSNRNLHVDDDSSTLSSANLRRELDYHIQALQQLREKYGLVDVERSQPATPSYTNHPHERKPHERQPHEVLEPSAALEKREYDGTREEENISRFKEIGEVSMRNNAKDLERKERKLSVAAIKASLKETAEELARLKAQESTSSQAVRKPEDGKAALQQLQQPWDADLPKRPNPPRPQNSNAMTAQGGVGGSAVGEGVIKNMSQQHTSSTSSSSWMPSNPLLGLMGDGGQHSSSGALNLNAQGRGSQLDSNANALHREWQNALQENKTLREEKRKLANSLTEMEGFARSLESTVRTNESQKRQQALQINVLSRDLAEARSERDHHKRLAGQLREQYAVVDAERVKFATQLSEYANLLKNGSVGLQVAKADPDRKVIKDVKGNEQERKLNEAAIKAILQADAEELARRSQASQAARKPVDAETGLPNRPRPPSQLNSNSTMARGGAVRVVGESVNMAQQPSTSSSGSSRSSSNTSTSWIPINPLRGLMGGGGQ